MTRPLVWDASFRRAFKRTVKRRPHLETKVYSVLQKLEQDPYDTSLRAHKLSGKLKDLWACWVEYDCRILYTFAKIDIEGKSDVEAIILVDIGTHDEVY